MKRGTCVVKAKAVVLVLISNLFVCDQTHLKIHIYRFATTKLLSIYVYIVEIVCIE